MYKYKIYINNLQVKNSIQVNITNLSLIKSTIRNVHSQFQRV